MNNDSTILETDSFAINAANKEESQSSSAMEQIRKSYALSATLESLVLCGLYVLCNVFAYPDSPGMVDVNPHPTLMIVVLIAARYGFTAAMIALLTAALTYGGLVYFMAEVPTYLHLVSKPYSTPIAVMVLASVLVGGIVEGHLKRVKKSDLLMAGFEKENLQLRSKQAELRDVNVELAEKIVASSSTLPALYRYAKALNVGDIQAIYQGICKLLEEVIEAKRVAVWRVEENRKILGASRGFSVGESPLVFTIDEALEPYFDERGVLAAHDIENFELREKVPFIVGRIMAGEKGGLAAYVAVEHLPIEKYTPETIRLFGIIVDWASSSVGNAYSMVSEWYEESQVFDSGFNRNVSNKQNNKSETSLKKNQTQQMVVEDRRAKNPNDLGKTVRVSDTHSMFGQSSEPLDVGSNKENLTNGRGQSLIDSPDNKLVDSSQKQIPNKATTKNLDLGAVISSARRPLKPAEPLVKPGSPLRGLPSRKATVLNAASGPQKGKPRLLRTLKDADGLLQKSRKRRESTDQPQMREEVQRATKENKPLGKLLGEIANYLEKQDKD